MIPTTLNDFPSVTRHAWSQSVTFLSFAHYVLLVTNDHNKVHMSRNCHESLLVCINQVVSIKSASEKFIRDSLGAQVCVDGSLSTDAML